MQTQRYRNQKAFESVLPAAMLKWLNMNYETPGAASNMDIYFCTLIIQSVSCWSQTVGRGDDGEHRDQKEVDKRRNEGGGEKEEERSW